MHGDALDPDVCDWTDGDVVFANSTCFGDALMRRLASAATALKKGAIFITLTKRLPVRMYTYECDGQRVVFAPACRAVVVASTQESDCETSLPPFSPTSLLRLVGLLFVFSIGFIGSLAAPLSGSESIYTHVWFILVVLVVFSGVVFILGTNCLVFFFLIL